MILSVRNGVLMARLLYPPGTSYAYSVFMNRSVLGHVYAELPYDSRQNELIMDAYSDDSRASTAAG